MLARTPREWVALCEALEAPELVADARFADNQSRVAHREALEQLLAAIFARRAAYWWMLQLTRADVPHTRPDLPRPQRQPADRGERVCERPRGAGSQTLHAARGAVEIQPVTAVQRAPAAPGDNTDVLEHLDARPPRSIPPTGSVRRGWLDGLVVGDATQGIAGPLAASVFAALGAAVFKWEPPSGDYMRDASPPHPSAGVSVGYLALNAGKRRRADALDPAELDVLFVDDDSSWLELDVATLQARYPRLVICRTADGPGSARWLKVGERTAQVQAECHVGLGRRSEPLLRIGPDIASSSAALAAVQGVLAALWERRQSTRTACRHQSVERGAVLRGSTSGRCWRA